MDLKATASAASVIIASIFSTVGSRRIDRAVSVTRQAYDASFAKLVSLVAYRVSRRDENQSILLYLFHWLARFVFVDSVPASLFFCFWVWERFRNFYPHVISNAPKGSRNTNDPMIESCIFQT